MKKLRKLATGAYGLVDSTHWKYLRVFETHELASGVTRITEIRIAKLPWDYCVRVTFGSPLFNILYERYRKRGNNTVGIRETTKLIRVSEVTTALIK